MANHPNRSKRLMTYHLGVYSDEDDYPLNCNTTFRVLRTIKRATDAEAEAEVDSLYYASGYHDDGRKRAGVYIRRSDACWFRRFSAHAGPGSASPDYLAPKPRAVWVKELGEWVTPDRVTD